VADVPFDRRVDLGRRRRLLVRRAALAGSAVLALAALAVSISDVALVPAERLAWAASVCAAGLVLGWVRAVVTDRRLDWRLVVAVAAVICGVVWQPLVPAVIAVVLLGERAVRRPPSTGVAVDGQAADGALSPIAGRLG
jgi:hypothetical protein